MSIPYQSVIIIKDALEHYRKMLTDFKQDVEKKYFDLVFDDVDREVARILEIEKRFEVISKGKDFRYHIFPFTHLERKVIVYALKTYAEDLLGLLEAMKDKFNESTVKFEAINERIAEVNKILDYRAIKKGY